MDANEVLPVLEDEDVSLVARFNYDPKYPKAEGGKSGQGGGRAGRGGIRHARRRATGEADAWDKRRGVKERGTAGACPGKRGGQRQKTQEEQKGPQEG